ncbi:MAG: hypothetical protein ABIQ95_03245, partial [Bdellovibrionia bacterium]
DAVLKRSMQERMGNVFFIFSLAASSIELVQSNRVVHQKLVLESLVSSIIPSWHVATAIDFGGQILRRAK